MTKEVCDISETDCRTGNFTKGSPNARLESHTRQKINSEMVMMNELYDMSERAGRI